LNSLLTKIRGEPNKRAAQVAKVVGKLVEKMPGKLEKELQALEAAVKSGEAEAVKRQRSAVQNSANDWLTYLRDHGPLIRICEANPWGLSLAIDKPVRASLEAILKVTR
jgi:hypothetical protein